MTSSLLTRPFDGSWWSRPARLLAERNWAPDALAYVETGATGTRPQGAT